MDGPLQVPPVLSTPDTRLAEATTTTVVRPVERSDQEFDAIYEVDRTADEIRRGNWNRVALQFPDELLPDAPRVYNRLQERLVNAYPASLDLRTAPSQDTEVPAETTSKAENKLCKQTLFILGDTSYSSCCVDEIAAEHVEADVVVHYGRACLSPTARLPVIHVFTTQALETDAVIEAFQNTYPEKVTAVILTADMPYANHIPVLSRKLQESGYQNLFSTEIRHNPSSPIPNRTVPEDSMSNQEGLKSWKLFHISSPPQALLLTLASRLDTIHIYPTDGTQPSTALQASTSLALRRRYALVTRLSRASIIGILVNTLSVHAYQAALEGTQARIAAAGKKAYVFAMGRLNAAKIANFAEVDGWVVLGCWESSLIENTDFDKPIVAPFELELALKGDMERVWTGQWRGDFDNMTVSIQDASRSADAVDCLSNTDVSKTEEDNTESESEPPEFDLRTGRYITPSRPMGKTSTTPKDPAMNGNKPSHSLVQRAKGEVALIGGEISPGAQFLRDKRTWRGLGSDFEIAYEDTEESTAIKEGRSGIARGYENERSSSS